MPRIISGHFKGQKLSTPTGSRTRPTADQVKEALFSMLSSLSFDLEGARVLDFFAGSGALGLEALSRGAATVILADQDRAAARAITNNLALLSVRTEAIFLRTRWPQGFQRLPVDCPFDLFLLDPPYDETELPLSLLKEAARRGLARPGAMAVWEQAPSTLTQWNQEKARPWELLKSRTWGSCAAAFLIYRPVD